jgi:hypothetical protein
MAGFKLWNLAQTFYTQLDMGPEPTSNKTFTLPNLGGQLALIDDIVTANVVLQTVYAENNVTGTGTGIFPYDGTIPQITEGNEILTVTITPKSANTRLVVTAQTQFGELSNTGNHGAAAIFRDSDVNAHAVGQLGYGGDNANLSGGSVSILHSELSGSTAQTTFHLRVGVDSGTTRWNGEGATQYYGTANKTTMMVMEVV